MAEIIHVIRTGSDTFNDIKAYLDKNPEYLLFQSPLGVTLKVSLKQEKEKSDGAENIVVRWMSDIKKFIKDKGSTNESSLKKIDAYCDAVIVAVTSE